MAMKAYESYKNVDLPWLKRVPEHWEITSLARVVKEQKIKKPKGERFQVLSLSYGKIIKKKDINFGLVPKDYDNYQLLHPGNIVLRFTDLQNDHKSLRTGLVTQQGIITSAYVCIDPIENPAYIHYLLHHYDTIKLFYGMGNGIRQSIGYKDISDVRIPVPPKEEQEQIVRYLDWQNSRLNKLINAKKREIALLEEQKQALISQAVTKGLDPHAPLKDSGIDWIGQIPEHWEINKMNRLFNLIGSGTTPSSGSVDFYDNGNIPWLNSGDLYGDKPAIQKTAKYITQLALNSFSTLKLYDANSIAIAMYGDHSLGNISVIPFSFCCNQACCIFSLPIPNINIKYVYYSVLSGKQNLIRQARGGGQPNINQDILRQFRLPFPPIHEQEHIVSYLNYQCTLIDNSIANINKTISLLQEYRTRLVADVVTGQIDVRHIAIPNYETITETIDQPEADEDSTICTEDQ